MVPPVRRPTDSNLRSACVFDGATLDQKQERGGLRTDRYFMSFTVQLWERACSRMRCVSQQIHWLNHRIREQARSHILISMYQVGLWFALALALALALDFDLRRPVKHAGRNSAWIWGVSRQGCRVSRPAPWMARGGGPQNPCRITGTPSLGEVPSVGARALLVTFGWAGTPGSFPKVTRCKSATLSGRYRSNGYVL